MYNYKPILLLTVFIFSTEASLSDLSVKVSETSPMSRALIKLLKSHNFESDATATIVNLINSYDENYTSTIETIEDISREMSEKISLQILDLKQANDTQNKARKFFNIIFVANFEDFKVIPPMFKNRKFHHDAFFTVVLMQKSDSQYNDMQSSFDLMWTYNMINVNILMTGNDNEIEVFTGFPYTKENCNGIMVQKINTFKNSSFDETNSIYPKKLQTLNKCLLKIFVLGRVPFAYRKKINNKTVGIDVEIIKRKETFNKVKI